MSRRKISVQPPATHFKPIQLAIAAIFIALILGNSAIALGAQKEVAVKKLTDDLISLNAQHSKTAPHLKPALLARLQNLAAERYQQLAALIESDPGAVLNVALPSLLRQNMPASARSAIEEHVEIDGELEVLHEDRAQGSRFVYKLKAFGLDYSLNFKRNPPTHLNSGTTIKARGVRVNAALALDSGDSIQALAAIAPNTFGEQRTLVILVKFADTATAPYDTAYAANIFNATSNFFLENSYGQTFLNTTIKGWFTLTDMNTPTASCDYSSIASKADAKAVADGVTLSNYTRKVYAFPNSGGCGWWGLGTVGGNPSRAWINGSLQLRVAGHEMGHNLGLWHSHSLDCGAAVLGGTCTVSEYGDTADIMGATANHFNAFQKERLGWLGYGASPPLTTANGNGSYSVSPFETVGNNAKTVKILKYTNPTTGKRQYFYAECRRPIGFDASLSSTNTQNGFVIHTGDEASSDSSFLLDLTPETSSWNDPALIVGSSFTDSVSGVTLTPEVPCTNTLNGSIYVSYGAVACVRGAPDITIAPTTNQTVAPGGSANYTLTVKNNDNAGCAAASFDIARSAPSGWNSTLGSSSLAIAPGGTANTTLTLTAPASGTDGIYPFSASATNAADASYTDSVNGAIAIYTITSVNLTLTTDRPSYTRRQNVRMTTTVTVNGSPAPNVTVNLMMTKANGTVNTMSAVTAANGVATYSYRISNRDPLGTWQVQANGTVGGVNGNASKSFTVQ